jgi:hypothetical protein
MTPATLEEKARELAAEIRAYGCHDTKTFWQLDTVATTALIQKAFASIEATAHTEGFNAAREMYEMRIEEMNSKPGTLTPPGLTAKPAGGE